MDWIPHALGSDDTDVTHHALLQLWQLVDDGCAETVQYVSAMPPRAWRRLGLLLFASDHVTVQTVVSIVVAVAVPTCHNVNEAHQRIQHRLWQSEWRQFLVDKLLDCHAHAARSTVHAAVAFRLVLVVRTVFCEALRCGMATQHDQVRTLDVFSELTQSPLDPLACGALQALQLSCLQLDPDVRAAFEASSVFKNLVAWVSASLASIPTDSKTHGARQRLTLNVLVDAVRQSGEVARTIAQQQAHELLHVVLSLIKCHQGARESDVVARAVELLCLVLQHDTPEVNELVSTIRRDGALITLSWLLGHTSQAVQQAARQVLDHCISRSSPRDLVRALVEQGCVLICVVILSNESRRLLQWIVSQFESQQDQLVESVMTTIRRSTNPKLQRNVLVALLLLSQVSKFIHGTLRDDVDLGHTLDEVLRANDCLATTFIATALLCCDKSSTLKSSTSFHRVSSLHDTTALTSLNVTLVCAAGAERIVDSVLLLTHCKRFARDFPRLVESSPSGIQYQLVDHDTETVELLLHVLPLDPQHAACELQRPERHCLLEKLLRLAKAIECTKCWHAASLAISSTLDSTNWKRSLDMAVRLRHPTLLLRTLRFASSSSTTFHSLTTKELEEAAIIAWKELFNNS